MTHEVPLCSVESLGLFQFLSWAREASNSLPLPQTFHWAGVSLQSRKAALQTYLTAYQ